MKIPILIISIILVLIIIFSLKIFNNNYNNQPKACINNHCFKLELAKTQEEQIKGLMQRSSLDQDKGMLFIFEEEAIYPFWMKNTLVPLDILWINSNNEIIYIARNVQPCKEQCFSISPNNNARYVLEINANLSEKYDFNIGDRLKLID